MWAVGRAAIRVGTRLAVRPVVQVRAVSQAIAADQDGLLISDTAVSRLFVLLTFE